MAVSNGSTSLVVTRRKSGALNDAVLEVDVILVEGAEGLGTVPEAHAAVAAPGLGNSSHVRLY
jgi:hypothetical protein